MALTLIGVLATGVLIGCSRTTRHKVLNVFFTGVPPLEDDSTTDPTDGPTPEETTTVSTEPGRKPVYQSEFWVHGPYGSGGCAQCHSTGGSKGLRVPTAGKSTFAAGENEAPSRLKLPVEQLCISCHTTHSNESIEKKGLWLHAPAAAGRCVDCHHPHQARERYLLRAATSHELCTGCHESGDLVKTESHRQAGEADCLSCHNAHVGDSSMLLIEEFDERQALYP